MKQRGFVRCFVVVCCCFVVDRWMLVCLFVSGSYNCRSGLAFAFAVGGKREEVFYFAQWKALFK